MNAKTETDILPYCSYKEKHKHKSDLKNNIYNKNNFTSRNPNSEINKNYNSILDDLSQNKIYSSRLKTKNNNYLNKFLKYSIKKSIFLNQNFTNYLKKEKKRSFNKEFKSIFEPYETVNHFYIKKMNLKDDIISNNNNNIDKKIAKTQTSCITNIDHNLKSRKYKSFKKINSRNLKRKNMFSKYSLYSPFNIDFFDDYKKDFFPNADFSKLEYNEKEIYRDKSIYEKLIKEKIDFFRNNENENHTIKFE